jgi:hypothetical protein
MEEIVGPVRSIVIGVVVKELEAGPTIFVTVPVTELAINCGVKVPALQLLTVRVNVVPDAAEIAKLQPVAVPALEKSEAATLFKFSDAVIEKVIGLVVFVGEVCAEVNTLREGPFG